MCLRALDTNQPLERYLELKAEIGRLTEELDALKSEITAALWDEPEHRACFNGYEIELGTRKAYRYSETAEAMERDLKALKDYERATGVAVVRSESSFPVVKPIRTMVS